MRWKGQGRRTTTSVRAGGGTSPAWWSRAISTARPSTAGFSVRDPRRTDGRTGGGGGVGGSAGTAVHRTQSTAYDTRGHTYDTRDRARKPSLARDLRRAAAVPSLPAPASLVVLAFAAAATERNDGRFRVDFRSTDVSRRFTHLPPPPPLLPPPTNGIRGSRPKISRHVHALGARHNRSPVSRRRYG